jgi:hypothetical protein
MAEEHGSQDRQIAEQGNAYRLQPSMFSFIKAPL